MGRALAYLLRHMIAAYNTPESSEEPRATNEQPKMTKEQPKIRRSTSREMIDSAKEDKGSLEFMGARMGLAIFVVHAGPNLVAVHHGSNDGFRGIYLACVSGPDAGKGYVVLSNGDGLASVKGVSMVLRCLLKSAGWQGFDFDA